MYSDNQFLNVKQQQMFEEQLPAKLAPPPFTKASVEVKPNYTDGLYGLARQYVPSWFIATSMVLGALIIGVTILKFTPLWKYVKGVLETLLGILIKDPKELDEEVKKDLK